MKATIITAKRKKIELITLLVCFILANLANLYSIIAYKTPAAELFTSLGYVVVTTVVFYVIWCILRLAFYWVKYLFRAKNKNNVECRM
jgi:cytochrome b